MRFTIAATLAAYASAADSAACIAWKNSIRAQYLCNEATWKCGCAAYITDGDPGPCAGLLY